MQFTSPPSMRARSGPRATRTTTHPTATGGDQRGADRHGSSDGNPPLSPGGSSRPGDLDRHDDPGKPDERGESAGRGGRGGRGERAGRGRVFDLSARNPLAPFRTKEA